MNILPGFSMGRVAGLPMPVKVLAGLLCGGSVLGVAWFILGDSPNKRNALIIIAMGMIVVFLLVAAFRALVEWNRKRKANPMAQGIAGNAAAAPQGVSEPARRARLDDLRRNFEQGVEKFRAAGKNLYSVPWYVLVGEPGSGKTEAIRHCNVGFPPGLQDQLQGAGGTLNMNWWFTNSAIILDTAGRLMFEEVVPGSTNEWNEFLKLLKNNRPNCPINGMLLVIPVDTLIKDTADNIEKKATKIAQQFDQIQRTLGVRFPVFVIITKCDLLNGFREFFDDLNDPQLQHQIMGWSNPASLDERFDPAQVTNHLETVRQRLVSRRQNLLLDPVHTEDAQARRVDQVDALYALPDSITKIGPRLRRYLEMIFVAGEWSPKPLFLRGIYFTSSMTEGAALDAELAEALGVPVDSLPGGAIFRKDRAYFLRDLFLEKVFREKGLVTRATNADKQQRTRRMVVLTFGFFAVVCLGLLTWLSARSLQQSLGAERNFWDAAAGLDLKSMAMIKADNSYRGDVGVSLGSKSAPLAQLFTGNLEAIRNDLQIPFVFRPMAAFQGKPNDERRRAYRALFESIVLRPAYASARAKITEAWDPRTGPGAVAELLKLEYAKTTEKLPPGPHAQVELAHLFAFDLSPEDYLKYQKDSEGLQKVADWVYTAEAAEGHKAWPPALLAAGAPSSIDALNLGVANTIKYWDGQLKEGKSQQLSAIDKVRADLEAFQAAQDELVKLKSSIDSLEVYNAYRDSWNEQIKKLHDAAKAATEDWAALAGSNADATLSVLYKKEMDALSSRARDDYKMLLPLTELPQGTNGSTAGAQALTAAHDNIKAAMDRLDALKADDRSKVLADLDARFIRTAKGTDGKVYARFQIYQQLLDMADGFVIKNNADVKAQLATLAKAFADNDEEGAKAINVAGTLKLINEENMIKTIDVAQFTIDASMKARKLLFSISALGSMPSSADAWPDAVAKLADAGNKDLLARPQVPLVSFPEKTFSAKFSPETVGNIVSALDAITAYASPVPAGIGTPAQPPRVLDASQLMTRTAAVHKAFEEYRDAYVHYWRDTAREDLRFHFDKYSQLADALSGVSEASIYEQLKAYGDRMVLALRKIGATEEATSIQTAPAVSREEAKHALSSWTNLGNDTKQVRRAVLAMEGGSFRDDYTVLSAKSGESYVARFWQGLVVEAVRVLAADGRAEIESGLTELAKYQRFPLTTAGDKKDDLSLADVLAARTSLEKIRGASNNTTQAASGTGSAVSRAIGAGGITQNKEVDAQLELLRGTNLLKDKQEYLDKLAKFLVCLPTDAKPLAVTFSVDKAKLGDAQNAISKPFSYMQIAQGGKELRVASLIASSNDTCSVDYAGGDLTLAFRETPDGKVLYTETLPGPWGIFRFLLNAKSVTREGNKWAVEYAITTADKRSWVLFVNLEFKQPVPDLKDWPVAPGK